MSITPVLIIWELCPDCIQAYRVNATKEELNMLHTAHGKLMNLTAEGASRNAIARINEMLGPKEYGKDHLDVAGKWVDCQIAVEPNEIIPLQGVNQVIYTGWVM